MNDSAVVMILRTILYGWVLALWELVKLVCAKVKNNKCEHQVVHGGCVRIDYPAFVRPDPLIYSQQYLIAQGLAVTYDNPDIALFKAGVPVSSANLEPATTYEVRARIWNNSTEAPAIDMPVHLSFLDFGVATQSNFVGTSRVDVGVLGSPDQPATATWLWTTPATPGHYCLQVLLDPADDVNTANNLGQENTDVVEAHSPAEFNFTLRNNAHRVHQYRFEIDAYQIPNPPRCDEGPLDRETTLNAHRRGTHPVPPGFAVHISPPSPTLNPNESALITVTVDPPGAFTGKQPINVNAFSEQRYAGGVSLYCVKEP